MKKFLSESPADTRKFAKAFVMDILRGRRSSRPLVLGLKGDLGSGKTTFIQAFIRELGVRKRITSPTFLIIRHYKLKTGKYKYIYHIDAYRLNKAKELLDLGFGDIIRDQRNIVLVEWADKVKNILPSKTIWISFGYGSQKSERIISI